MALLDHPNTVGLLDRGAAGGLRYLVMPAVVGDPLRRLIADSPGGLPRDRALGILDQALAGVGAVHAAGVVHRDLKPENILVLHGRGTVKVLDFGISRFLGKLEADTYRTAVGAISGSPAYIAPETVMGDPFDQRTDLYSLGTVLFELLTGKTPLSAKSPYGYLREHMVSTPRSLAQARPERTWPDALEELLARLLAKLPGDRPASCEEVRAQLAAVRGEALATEARPGPGVAPAMNGFLERR